MDSLRSLESKDLIYYQDINYRLRSGWEANMVRFFNYHNISWKYEDEEVNVSLDAIRIYRPDFFVNVKNKELVIEVKGFWDKKSIEDVFLFRKKYPERQFMIIDNDLYYSMQESSHRFIDNWEYSVVLEYSEYKITVVGLTFNNRLETVNKIKIGEDLLLCRDKNNIYDPNAIKVYTNSHEEVGFICKEWASILALKMDFGLCYKAYLFSKSINDKTITIKVYRTGNVPDDYLEILFGINNKGIFSP